MVISTQIDGSGRHGGGMPQSGGVRDGSVNQRAKRVHSAQRHSKVVHLLRRLLPLCAIGVIGYYAATFIGASGLGGQIALKAIPKILPADLTMHNPSYRGYTKTGGAYVVRAKTAKQDPKLNKHILLTKVSGDLTQKSGTTLKLQADDGTFDTESESITLRNNVSLTSSSGAWARLETVSIDNRTGLITSDRPVEFGNPRATIKGRNLQIKRKTNEMALTGSVVAIIQAPQSDQTTGQVPAAQNEASTPRALAPATGGAATGATLDAAIPTVAATPRVDNAVSSPALTRMFTRSKGPIEVTSERLELDDVKKTATFIGNVVATQGETRLTTPELRVAYDGAPTGGLAGGPSTATQMPEGELDGTQKGGKKTSSEAKITAIVASEPVAITQAPATHMTARTAAFDARSQRASMTGEVIITRAPDTRITGDSAGFDDIANVAHIDGNVVLTQGSDRRATGDHAEFNSKTETALLTGNVVLNQGPNVLNGRRLYIDQKAGRTELTSPPMGSSGPGRITARFIQPETAASNKKSRKSKNAEGDNPFAMASFQTEPGAPIDIAADQLEVIEPKKLAVFRGNVDAKQGGFKFRTAELNAIYSGEAGIAQSTGAQPDAAAAERASAKGARITRLQARGKVVVTSANGQTASGDWADFDVAANKATLGGDVELKQGRNIVKGTRLVINMATGETVINTDNSITPGLARNKPGGAWRAYEKPSRPSAVFFPSDARKKSGDTNKPKAKVTSGWNSTTSPGAN